MNKITMNECSRRKLDEIYIVVHAIKNEINIKKGDYIEKSIIYTFVGIDTKGYRQLIDVYQDRINNNRYWLDCFETLKSRGLKNVLFLSVDDNKNMKRAAKIAFSDIVFVDSPTDIVPRFYKHTSSKSSKQLGSKLFMLYTQKTLNDFKEKFDIFKKTYNNVIHQKLIEKYLNNVEGLYKYSANIRHLLFKHTANVYLYDRIRLNFNERSCYISKIDEIYEHLGEFSSYFGFTSFTKKDWTLILNDLIQMYPQIDFI
ncbi:MAG: transposase [Bacilli bacterium]|nr:transposase [Bacilli bacterium]